MAATHTPTLRKPNCNIAKPYICREQTLDFCEKTQTWEPNGKYVWVLYDSKYKESVLTYKDTWKEIVAAAKLVSEIL